MYNPWANGWSDESENPTNSDLKPAITTSSWTPEHALSASEGAQEDDLSAPSWSTGPDIKWAEPSQIRGSLWSQTAADDHLDAWGSSTYKGITLGPLASESLSPQEKYDRDESPPLSPVQQEKTPRIPSPEEITPPRVPSPVPQSAQFPSSPDAFGSFETAADAGSTVNDDPWFSSASAFPPDNEEVHSWTAPKVGEAEEATEVQILPDEWEIAKRRKENMDRQVVRNI